MPFRGYKKAPRDVSEAMDKAVRVDDFLPSPEDLVRKEPTKKITLAIGDHSLYLFKTYARKHGGKYQNMMRRILDRYAEKALAEKV